VAHAARLARLKERELFQLVAANTTKNIIGSDRGGTLDPVDTVLSRLLLLAYFNALRVLGEL
jgi:hypothetical protein